MLTAERSLLISETAAPVRPLTGRAVTSPKRLVSDPSILRLDARDLRRLGVFQSAPGARWRLSWVEGSREVAWLRFEVERGAEGPETLRLRQAARDGLERDLAGSGVDLTRTRCFGGRRAWLVCPRCSCRVRGLYWLPEGLPLACRLCAMLTYPGQQAHRLASFMALERPFGAWMKVQACLATKRPSKRLQRAQRRFQRTLAGAERYERALGVGR